MLAGRFKDELRFASILSLIFKKVFGMCCSRTDQVLDRLWLGSRRRGREKMSNRNNDIHRLINTGIYTGTVGGSG